MPKRKEGPTLNKQTGYYFFDEYVGFGHDRQRVRFSLKTPDPEKARLLWEMEYRRQWRQYYGEEEPEKPRKIKFKDVISEFVDYERDIKKAKEWKTMNHRLRIISSFWGDINIDQINSGRLAELDEYLRNNDRSPKTINHYMGILKTLFYYAIRKNIYKGDNPISEVKPHIVDDKRREYSPDELNRILSAADSIEQNAPPHSILQRYAKRIVLLLLFTGMRIGELLNLKWQNIQGDKIILKRTETKQKKEKMIPISKTIQALLESLSDKRRTDGFVIPRPGGSNLTSSGSTGSLITKMKKLTGIPDFDLHSLRHTASTIMVSQALGKGVGLADIMKVLGHSRVETTMKYVHADFDRMKKAVDILEEKAIINRQKDAEKPNAQDGKKVRFESISKLMFF